MLNIPKGCSIKRGNNIGFSYNVVIYLAAIMMRVVVLFFISNSFSIKLRKGV
jgi:hypothetical protein